jgi:hypothetical protein
MPRISTGDGVELLHRDWGTGRGGHSRSDGPGGSYDHDTPSLPGVSPAGVSDSAAASGPHSTPRNAQGLTMSVPCMSG